MLTHAELNQASRRYRLQAKLICAALAFVLVCTASISTLARDFDVLVRIAYAAFLVDQGSAVCAGARLNFSSEDAIALKNAKSYAQWVKQRISIGLRNDEVQSVLVPAADRARAEAREAVGMLHSGADVFRWCTATVAPLARQVVGAYMRNRTLIEEIIQKAKDGSNSPTSGGREAFPRAER